jgi:hypothetical protein
LAALIIAVMRYTFLLLLYLFLWRVTRLIYRDLQTGEAASVVRETKPGDEQASKGIYRLVVVAAPAKSIVKKGKTYNLGERTTIGREPGNGIAIPEPHVSALHAVVYLSGGSYWIEDLGSTNGTFVNGLPVREPTILTPGDDIYVGKVTFRLVG